MVDALRRAHRIVGSNGVVIDLHPSPARAVVEVGPRQAGFVDAGDAPLRHAKAGAAVAAAIGEGLYQVERSVGFVFYTYGDTIEELTNHLAACWRNARIADDAIRRATNALRHLPGIRPRVREEVYATRLRAI